MTVALTQSDFRAHLKEYLDRVNDDDETIYIARSNSRSVAVISQEKMAWMEKALQAKEDSLVESNDEYWEQFK